MSKIHPALAKVFRDFKYEEFAFLESLSESDQEKLAKLIDRRLEEESSGIYSTLSFVSNILPKFVKVRIAQEMLGPKITAKMTSYVSTKQAVEMANALKPDFLAEVAIYLRPEEAAEVMSQTRDSVLLAVTHKLIEQGQFQTIASLAEHLPSPKLISLTRQLNHPEAIVQISNEMTNREKLVEIAVAMDDTFLRKLVDAIHYYQYYELAAMVGSKMPIERQVRLLRQMDASVAAKLAAHYEPELIGQILEHLNDEEAINIAMEMNPDTLAHLFNYLSADIINRILPYLSIEKIKQSKDFVNKMKIEKHWQEFTEQAQKILSELFPNLG
ncbi:MAG: hypothetical protein D6767_05365 [Candidatus Hydrogenedentota bacterium]|nr:MAG: hypothetical protein D6767_05365 [Candidatus Hydrogenedentota bacterium]